MSDGGFPVPPEIAKALFDTEYSCECGWVGRWKDSGVMFSDGVLCPRCSKHAREYNDAPIIVDRTWEDAQ